MNEPLDENNFVRLAKALMEKHRIPYEQALGRLAALRLHIVCDPESLRLAAYQAALLTAVNCGGRSFLGGVHVSLPDGVPIHLPWPNETSLGKAVLELGGRLEDAGGGFDAIIVAAHRQAAPPAGFDPFRPPTLYDVLFLTGIAEC